MQVTVNDGDVAKGAKIFKTKCAQCHNAEQVSVPACCSLDLTRILGPGERILCIYLPST